MLIANLERGALDTESLSENARSGCHLVSFEDWFLVPTYGGYF
jgi:hypothetical protein